MSVLDLSCKSEDPPVRPEARVEIKVESSSQYDFVRIPVTSVDMWINKDGPADINRNAKVKFPAEWSYPESVVSGVDIIESDSTTLDITSFINGFQQFQEGEGADAGDPYDECRIYFYDEDLDTEDDDSDPYVLNHYGFVGGVGPATEDGVMKLWVYDPADLMRSIQISKSWGNPSLGQVIQFAVSGTDDQGDDVGLRNRSVFDSVTTYIAGEQRVPERKQEDIREDPARVDLEFPTPTIKVGPYKISLGGVVSDVINTVFELIDDLLQSQKQFRLNRHNMVDHMNWFTGLIDARWFFEPSPDGPILFIDATGYSNDSNTNIRREFFAEGVIDSADSRQFQFIQEDGGESEGVQATDESVFATSDILENDALYDIKPFNTMYVYGESASSSEIPTRRRYEHSASPYAELFPYVKVTYPPLVDRAGGYEYAAPAKETDDLTIESAESTAVKEFREHLAENTEGEIILKGEPHIMPHDNLTAIPVCRDIYTEVDAQPIKYEVNQVHHRRRSGEHYTTEVGVSLAFDESKLEIESELKDS